MRRMALATAVLGLILPCEAYAIACGPFLSIAPQPTLREEAATARVVLYGTLAKPRPRIGAEWGDGTTDLHIRTVVKGGEHLQGRKVVELQRHIPNPQAATYLIFCELDHGRLVPFRGIPVQSVELIDYVKGTMTLDPKKTSEFLSYFFRHLDHANSQIADDALMEFAKIDYRNVPPWAKQLPADKLARWLEQPNLPAARVRLYASLLGDCGDARQAALLRRLLDQARTQDKDLGMDDLLFGYTVLRPKEGWAYLRRVLGDAKAPFVARYGALKAIRFLWGARPDLVTPDELASGLMLTLDQGDFADLAIDELRQHKRWEVIEQILGYYGKDSHAAPVVRRSIVRYALSCPHTPKTLMFLAERRRAEPGLVEDSEEWLSFEGTQQSDSPLRP